MMHKAEGLCAVPVAPKLLVFCRNRGDAMAAVAAAHGIALAALGAQDQATPEQVAAWSTAGHVCPWGPSPNELSTVLKKRKGRDARQLGPGIGARTSGEALLELFHDMSAAGWTETYAACVVGQLISLEDRCVQACIGVQLCVCVCVCVCVC